MQEMFSGYATIAHQGLKRRDLLPDKIVGTLSTLDSIYLAQEGEALFSALTLLDEYPGNNLTSRPVSYVLISFLICIKHRVFTSLLNLIKCNQIFRPAPCVPQPRAYNDYYKSRNLHIPKDEARSVFIH